MAFGAAAKAPGDFQNRCVKQLLIGLGEGSSPSRQGRKEFYWMAIFHRGAHNFELLIDLVQTESDKEIGISKSHPCFIYITLEQCTTGECIVLASNN